MMQPLLERITIQPGLMGGKPTIRGLRFPVSDILELLSNGLSESDIPEQHPIPGERRYCRGFTYSTQP